MEAADLESCAGLLQTRRWAALATAGSRGPLASMVAFALDRPATGLLLHLSTLAVHTRNLQASPCASLVVSESDPGDGDPQELARLTLSGPVARIAPDAPNYGEARAAYVARFPAAEARFSFGDFGLYRLVPDRVAYVGGFARARSQAGSDFMAAIAPLLSAR